MPNTGPSLCLERKKYPASLSLLRTKPLFELRSTHYAECRLAMRAKVRTGRENKLHVERFRLGKAKAFLTRFCKAARRPREKAKPFLFAPLFLFGRLDHL